MSPLYGTMEIHEQDAVLQSREGWRKVSWFDWFGDDMRGGVLNAINLKAWKKLGEFEGEDSKINFVTLGISLVSLATSAASA